IGGAVVRRAVVGGGVVRRAVVAHAVAGIVPVAAVAVAAVAPRVAEAPATAITAPAVVVAAIVATPAAPAQAEALGRSRVGGHESHRQRDHAQDLDAESIHACLLPENRSATAATAIRASRRPTSAWRKTAHRVPWRATADATADQSHHAYTLSKANRAAGVD